MSNPANPENQPLCRNRIPRAPVESDSRKHCPKPPTIVDNSRQSNPASEKDAAKKLRTAKPA
ncbi:MAG: hypothetical protein DBX55_06295 [Verrucomicrobia bacterium]|nr:MAG: hypothetical protein DBX55_06295 [Verrucomicrobiota bacterium]